MKDRFHSLAQKFGADRLHLPEAALLLVSALLLFGRLGTTELGSADEAIHAQVAREMVRDGHWLFPTYRGEPYFEKPPFKFWLTALTFRVAGESEFTARVWSAIFGLAAVWGVMRLGRLFFNRGAGLAGALVLATTWEFLYNHCARTGELDSALLFFMVVLVGAFWKVRVRQTPRHLHLAVFWMALGFLTKGHLILIPLIWLPLVWWIRPARGGSSRAANAISGRHLLGAALIFLGVAAPWFVLQAMHYGATWSDYMVHHNLAGYMRGTVENADADPWYYLEEVVRFDYPWPPLAVLGFLVTFRRRAVADFPAVRAARIWLMAWIVTMVLVLSASQTRLPWYHLPLLVPLAMLAGLVVERWWNSEWLMRQRVYAWLWLALHVGLLFALAGFLECLQDWFEAWMQHDVEMLAGCREYFLHDYHLRSVVVALLVLPIFPITALCRLILSRRGVARAHVVAARLRIVLLGGVAIFATQVGRISMGESENARETSGKIIAQVARNNAVARIHLFDSPKPHTPHFDVTPSMYYYLASSPRLDLLHHPDDRETWRQFQRTLQHPCWAIVPSALLGEGRESGIVVTPLEEMKSTRLIRVERSPCWRR